MTATRTSATMIGNSTSVPDDVDAGSGSTDGDGTGVAEGVGEGLADGAVDAWLAVGVGVAGAGVGSVTVKLSVPRSTSPSSATEVHSIEYAPGASARPSRVIVTSPSLAGPPVPIVSPPGPMSLNELSPDHALVERERDDRGRGVEDGLVCRVGRDELGVAEDRAHRGEREERAGEEREDPEADRRARE